MVCEKCNKKVGSSKLNEKKTEMIPTFTEEVKKCKSCGAVYCNECFNTAKIREKCFCCGKQIETKEYINGQ